MNVSAGGPHILFFERDPQLTALLTSQFQLAGYECHAARTAVEVFDTIARFPVRILLVNLAQAAAGRREFWVALDTQRRGRGVQVLTYLCSSLAGYGPRDPDDRSQGQLPDIEIDGMLGLMNLVDTVRERVPGMSSASLNPTQVRLPRATPPSTPSPVSSQPATNASGTAYRSGASDTSHAATITATVATQNPPVQQSYSEKIRAVLYPTQRPTNIQAETIQTPQQGETPVTYVYPPAQNTVRVEQAVPTSQIAQSYGTEATALQRLAYGQSAREQESGLDQLSRMLQERSVVDETIPDGADGESQYVSSITDTPRQSAAISYAPAPQQMQTADTVETQALRASPIEDLPLERATNGGAISDSGRRADGRTTYSQYAGSTNTAAQAGMATQATPLASISGIHTTSVPDTPPMTAKATMPMAAVTSPQPVVRPTVQEQRSTGVTQVVQQREQYAEQQETPVVTEERTDVQTRTDDLIAREQQAVYGEEREEMNLSVAAKEQQEQVLEQERQQDIVVNRMTPNNAMLLDIVQSLPLMPSPPPQPDVQTISGRTMRTLGSVLLEGHLVPESRLEVAQNIQRMLSGVDLNYQLGEILLMFKLLTPDQLLAASLVSYGMISTQQISALGRIRQELHAIGLEYDLESLLILFRMITPEQLREVRTSWQG